MFVFVPVSLGMLPDELWPRAMTSLFYTYVVIFYMLSSVSTALTVQMITHGIIYVSNVNIAHSNKLLFNYLLIIPNFAGNFSFGGL